MEVAFMEARVLFLNSFLAWALLSCLQPEEKMLLKDPMTISWEADRLRVNQKMYTGGLFQLFPNGRDTASVEHYVQGLEDGVWRKYYPSGRLFEIRTFQKGKKIGTYEAWWENGKRMRVFEFENDEYQGFCREWNSSGQLIREMHYEKGHEQGTQKMFYDNGKIKSNYWMENGRRYGLLGTKNCRNISEKIFKN